MRKSTTIAIDRKDRESLAELAQGAGVSLGEMIHRLVERERTRRFWKEADEAYKRLRNDEESWAGYRAESDQFERASLEDLRRRDS